MSTFLQTLSLNNHTWHFTRNRASGNGQIFLSEDHTMFLRTGPSASIQAEVDFSAKLQKQGFPIPEILDVGTIDGMGYFTERSLGDETLGTMFRREFSEGQKVSNESFNLYCHVSQKILAAQLQSSSNVTQNAADTKTLIRLENVTKENPDLDSKILHRAVDKAVQRISHLPNVLSHGDLTPFNLLANGVIDFEHSFVAPVGYDILTGVIWGRLWNFKDDLGVSKLSYDFTDKQVDQYLTAVNQTAAEQGVEKLSDYLDDFTVLKSIWSLSNEKKLAEQSGKDNKWLFRRAIVKYCIEQYLADTPIESKKFKNLTNIYPSN